MYDNFSMNRVFAVSFLASFLLFVAMFFFLLLTNSHAHAQGYDVSTRVTVASEIKERSTERVSAKRKKPRHIVVMQARKADPESLPLDPHPSCKAVVWASVTTDTVAQVTALIAKYNATRDELSKLGSARDGELVKIYRGAPHQMINQYVGSPVYEDIWPEAYEWIRDGLQRRLANLTCKLRGLGVTVDAVKVSAPPT